MKTFQMFLTVGLLSVSAAGFAAPEDTTAEIDLGQPESLFVELDVDNSGTLTTNEVDGFSEIKASYKAIDSNSNGEIDAEEFAKYEMAGEEPATEEPLQ